jgi:predicted Zn finger-like uncharacterized protein
MLVRCPKCRTTYKVSDELLKGSAPAFRCSRCKYTFELEAHTLAENQPSEHRETSPASASAENEPGLPFEPEQPDAANGGAEKTSGLPDEKELGSTDSEAAAIAARDGEWAIRDAGDQAHLDFIVPADEPPLRSPTRGELAKDSWEKDPFFAKMSIAERSEESDNILAISPYLDQRASVLPFVSLFCLLIIGFTLFSVISYANPRGAESMIKAIPLFGPAALRNNHLRQGVVVQSLRTGYQTIQGNREVFLVSGIAINQNPEVIREIQLSAVTYNEEGKELERQMIWAGNTISPKIIRGMTAEDIPHLQDLKPLKSFELPPGDSIPFTIVFLKSAKNAKTFSCEVLAAESRN